MSEAEFERWYEFVNDVDLRAAAYTGLVSGPARIAELEGELAAAQELLKAAK